MPQRRPSSLLVRAPALGLLVFLLAVGLLGPLPRTAAQSPTDPADREPLPVVPAPDDLAAPAQPAGLLPLGDAYIASGRPAENFSAKTTLWIGHNATGYGEEQALLAFAADGLPPRGAVIRSATLYLCLGGVTGAAPLPIHAHRILAPFDPAAVTWQTRPPYEAQPAGGVNVAAALGWYAWDVRAALQTWADERDTPAFGLLLRSDAGDGHERTFWSRDYTAVAGQQPYLAVEYDAPTLTPTFTPSPTPSATPTLTPTPSPTPTGAWGEWLAPQTTILLPRGGEARVSLRYHNAPAGTSLIALVVGPAEFANTGGAQFMASIAGEGVYTLRLRARPGANVGEAFYLSATVGANALRPDPRPGHIAETLYLPLIVLRGPIQQATSTPTNTPTFTPTFTPSRTPTNTPSATWTPSPTMTASATSTSTASNTPSVTPTRTRTFTPTNTPSATWTPSPTMTASATNTPTKTFTPTNTPITPTRTPTKTRTPTSTPTDPISPIATPTKTPTTTPTPWPTVIAPSNVSAQPLSSTTMLLTWQDNSGNETGFHIWDGADYSRNLPANTTAHTVTGIPPGTWKCYDVRAYVVVDGQSFYSPFIDWACNWTYAQ